LRAGAKWNRGRGIKDMARTLSSTQVVVDDLAFNFLITTEAKSVTAKRYLKFTASLYKYERLLL
jgi:hypothetical protein